MDKRCISRLLFLSSSHETGSSLAGPFVFYFGGIGAYNMMSSKMEGYDVFSQTLGNLWFWLAVPLISAVAVLPTWCYFFAAKRFFPNDDEEVLRMARELGEVRRPAKKKNVLKLVAQKLTVLWAFYRTGRASRTSGGRCRRRDLCHRASRTAARPGVASAARSQAWLCRLEQVVARCGDRARIQHSSLAVIDTVTLQAQAGRFTAHQPCTTFPYRSRPTHPCHK